ncbi:MAG: carboxypeptidase regulatory-like domain-containing protein [Limisphaerales bacterium]
MKFNHQVLTIAALLASAPGLAAADITGKITLKGSPPTEKTIDMSADAKCSAAHPQPITTRHYVVGSDGGLANVFVYLKSGLEGKTFPAPTDTPVLDQVGCEYNPYVLGVQVNQKFKIKNSDSTMHNVHAMPKVNQEFNFAQPIPMASERSFSKPEVMVRFKCDVHPWMFAYMGVVDGPCFAVSAKDGAFTLKNVPPGKYTIAAVHLKAGTQTQEIEVADGQNKPVDFTFEVKPAN